MTHDSHSFPKTLSAACPAQNKSDEEARGFLYEVAEDLEPSPDELVHEFRPTYCRKVPGGPVSE